MSLRAIFRRRTAVAVVALTLAVAMTAIAPGAAATTTDAPAGPPAYPPTVPCALSVSSAALATGAVQFTMVGTGLGALERVELTLDPAATRLGSFLADATGAFTRLVALSPAQVRLVQRISAASSKASCSTRLPTSVPSTGRTSRPSPSMSAANTAPPVQVSPHGPGPSSRPSVASQPSTSAGPDSLLLTTLAGALGLLVIGGLAVFLLTRRRG